MDNRIKRIESRLCQLMIYLGANPQVHYQRRLRPLLPRRVNRYTLTRKEKLNELHNSR